MGLDVGSEDMRGIYCMRCHFSGLVRVVVDQAFGQLLAACVGLDCRGRHTRLMW